MDGYRNISLEDWICMVAHESNFDTQAVGRINRNGSRDYGIFQINSRYWCNHNRGRTSTGCNKICSGMAGEKTAMEEICQDGLGAATSETDLPSISVSPRRRKTVRLERQLPRKTSVKMDSELQPLRLIFLHFSSSSWDENC
ncbi:lysozyme-like [Thamnophis elegans]|uniref:lysozyme-like n=1 Tax=Thamnophis elegans TaxID=35005 RepID=UPI00137706F7|nr:lysozyme-like [Thamnophis elegans]